MRTYLSVFSVACLLLVGISVMPGCLYQNEATLFPSEPPPMGFCDTTVVSYQTDIVPILSAAGCRSCHSSPSSGGGVDLSTHTKVKFWVDDGKFLCAIEHESGCKNMPQGGSKLPETDLAYIRCWITQGALDN